MLKKTKISVIVPVYNVERYIERCLRSILNQSLHDIELVIVNDCTLDNSMSVVSKFFIHETRMKVINNNVNHGLMMARKIGFDNATGEYIVFCDSDDYLPLNALEILYNEIIKSDTDLVLGSCTYINTKERKRYIPRSNVSCNSLEDIKNALFAGSLKSYLCASIFKRNIFLNSELLFFDNVVVNEDKMLLIQIMMKVSSASVLDLPIYYYCQNDSSSTRTLMSMKQLNRALFSYTWCLNYLISNDVPPNMVKKDCVRKISFLLEKGYNKTYFKKWDDISNLYLLSNLLSIFSLLLSVHHWILFHSYFYSYGCDFSRKFIKLIQRK